MKLWFNTTKNEYIDGFTFYNYVEEFIDYMSEEILMFKRNFLESLTLIPKHKQVNPSIDDELRENDSHYEDNEIINDLYEYHLEHNINFVFFSFDEGVFDT